MIYLRFTYDSLMIYIWFTYDLHMIYIWFTYDNTYHLKSGFSLRMKNGMVQVSSTGTRASLSKIEVMGTTYRTCNFLRRATSDTGLC